MVGRFPVPGLVLRRLGLKRRRATGTGRPHEGQDHNNLEPGGLTMRHAGSRRHASGDQEPLLGCIVLTVTGQICGKVVIVELDVESNPCRSSRPYSAVARVARSG